LQLANNPEDVTKALLPITTLLELVYGLIALDIKEPHPITTEL